MASLEEDYWRFRGLMQGQVRYRLKHYPVILDTNWVIECYFSIEEFELEFPDSYLRDEYLREVEYRREESRNLRRTIQVMIDAIPWNNPPALQDRKEKSGD
ncbi:hypothetical protein CMI38_01400 [Candidatus Pacearchaeota archaeon]|jgi:hypothetical protein|nr:hypothetical protein [Candidatus Pacearchaeota archaeon]|tara:strand:+ start:4494 stop:4796 length:303 start_codon:yes stop_codon:yes gene_type:complete